MTIVVGNIWADYLPGGFVDSHASLRSHPGYESFNLVEDLHEHLQAPDDHTLAILSGSDGHDIDRLEEIGQAYRLPKDILFYSTIHDKWIHGGDMPLGVMGVQLMQVDDGFILASGEYSPGLRSTHVFHLKRPNPKLNPPQTEDPSPSGASVP